MEKLESIPSDLTFHSWAEAMKFASDHLPHSSYRLTRRSDGTVHLVLLGRLNDDVSVAWAPFC